MWGMDIVGPLPKATGGGQIHVGAPHMPIWDPVRGHH